jgi:hypothetical protein
LGDLRKARIKPCPTNKSLSNTAFSKWEAAGFFNLFFYAKKIKKFIEKLMRLMDFGILLVDVSSFK